MASEKERKEQKKQEREAKVPSRHSHTGTKVTTLGSLYFTPPIPSPSTSTHTHAEHTTRTINTEPLSHPSEKTATIPMHPSLPSQLLQGDSREGFLQLPAEQALFQLMQGTVIAHILPTALRTMTRTCVSCKTGTEPISACDLALKFSSKTGLGFQKHYGSRRLRNIPFAFATQRK